MRCRTASVKDEKVPARTGKQYIERLKACSPVVYIDGERVTDVTEHPALANGVKTIAGLYDLQTTHQYATR